MRGSKPGDGTSGGERLTPIRLLRGNRTRTLSFRLVLTSIASFTARKSRRPRHPVSDQQHSRLCAVRLNATLCMAASGARKLSQLAPKSESCRTAQTPTKPRALKESDDEGTVAFRRRFDVWWQVAESWALVARRLGGGSGAADDSVDTDDDADDIDGAKVFLLDDDRLHVAVGWLKPNSPRPRGSSA